MDEEYIRQLEEKAIRQIRMTWPVIIKPIPAPCVDCGDRQCGTYRCDDCGLTSFDTSYCKTCDMVHCTTHDCFKPGVK